MYVAMDTSLNGVLKGDNGDDRRGEATTKIIDESGIRTHALSDQILSLAP